MFAGAEGRRAFDCGGRKRVSTSSLRTIKKSVNGRHDGQKHGTNNSDYIKAAMANIVKVVGGLDAVTLGSFGEKEKSYVLTTSDPNKPEKDNPDEPGFPFQPADV